MPGQALRYCIDTIDVTLSLLCADLLLDSALSQQFG